MKGLSTIFAGLLAAQTALTSCGQPSEVEDGESQVSVEDFAAAESSEVERALLEARAEVAALEARKRVLDGTMSGEEAQEIKDESTVGLSFLGFPGCEGLVIVGEDESGAGAALGQAYLRTPSGVRRCQEIAAERASEMVLEKALRSGLTAPVSEQSGQ